MRANYFVIAFLATFHSTQYAHLFQRSNITLDCSRCYYDIFYDIFYDNALLFRNLLLCNYHKNLQSYKKKCKYANLKHIF